MSAELLNDQELSANANGIESEESQAAEPTALETPEVESLVNESSEPYVDADEGDDESELTEPEALPHKKGGFQRKLEKLQQENDKLQQQLKAVAGISEQLGVEKPKPKADDFDSYDEYLENLAEWHIENKSRKQASEYREHLVRTEEAARIESFKKSVEVFSAITPDYLDVLKSVDDISIPPAVQQMLLAMDNGPALMYELAKDRGSLQAIISAPPMQAALKLGQFSAKVTASKATPPTTSAKPPLKPVGGSSTTSQPKAIEAMTASEYRAWRTQNP